MAGIAVAFLAVFAWLAPRIYRAVRTEWTALGALLGSWFGEVRKPRLTLAQEQWLREHCSGQTPGRLFDVIATADIKGLRNAVGVLSLAGREAVFFPHRRRGTVACRIGPLRAFETGAGFLLDRISLTALDGTRSRYNLLAGQLDSAREEARRQPAA